MILALTGTPGTGKTTIAHVLKKKEINVIDLKNIAEIHDFIESYDKKRLTNVIDISAVDRYLKTQYSSQDQLVIEGHLSHLLTCVQTCIVLRCYPKILKKRLQERDWSWKKIRENVEAELLDIILCEALEHHGTNNVYEIDTSTSQINEIADEIYQVINGKTSDKIVKPGSFDWSECLFDSTIMENKSDGVR